MEESTLADGTLSAPKQELVEHLKSIAQALPREQIVALVDFAEYLHTKHLAEQPRRGSIDAFLEFLDRAGPLQFEPGELDRILAEIEQARDLDLEAHG
jgi:hypothetical protein